LPRCFVSFCHEANKADIFPEFFRSIRFLASFRRRAEPGETWDWQDRWIPDHVRDDGKKHFINSLLKVTMNAHYEKDH